MPVTPTDGIDLDAARAALADVVPRLTRLIRSVRDPGAHAVGEWNVTDVAVHLGSAWAALPALARGEMGSPLRDVSDLAALTTAMVREEVDRDLDAVATRIEAAAAAFLRLCDDPDRPARGPWLVEGIEAPFAMFACHLLNESLVHGDDIARADGRPWRIDPAHAALAVMGFLVPAISRLDPRSLVIAERAAGVDARLDVSLRGRGRVVLHIHDCGLTLEPPSSTPVDCHISADAASFLLLLFGRRGQWGLTLRGGLLSWGRRPWLAPRLRAMVRNP